MLLMKKSAAKTAGKHASPKARKVVDAPLVDLRAAVAAVQDHLDAIVRTIAEAEKLHREHIRCEPRGLRTAAEFAGRVRRSVEGSWERSKPHPF